MKKIITLIIMFAAFGASAQIIDLDVNIDFVKTTKVTRISLVPVQGSDWSKVSRQFLYSDNGTNKWGRELIPEYLAVTSDAGEDMPEVRAMLNSVKTVYSEELFAAGQALGLSWETAKGEEELAVVVMAFAIKVGTTFGVQPMVVFQSIIAQLQPQ